VELWVLTVRDSQNQLRGIAPLARFSQHLGPLRLGRLAFAGDGWVYRAHRDVLAPDQDKQAVVAAVLSYLATVHACWDVFELEGLAEGTYLGTALAGMQGRLHTFEDDLVRPYVMLPTTWREYELERLSANTRQQLRAKRRKLEHDYPGQVVEARVETQADLRLAQDALIHLHRRRWHGKGRPSGFDSPAYLSFHREIWRLAADQGWLRFYWLKIGERVLAVWYAFRYGDVLYSHSTAFDTDFGAYRPGQVLLGAIVRDAIAEGVRTFDLGPGSQAYKFQWASGKQVDRHLVLSTTLRGDIWAYGQAFWRATKGWYRQRVAPRIPAQLVQALRLRRDSGPE
jgi:CelD/BcsL family acetyltransferase involved in cellulose biosynthesis